LQIDADANEHLHGAERKMKGGGETCQAACGDRWNSAWSGVASTAATVRKAWLIAKSGGQRPTA